MTTKIYMFLILVLCILSIKAVNISPKPRIVGGSLARAGQFKFAAAIYVETEDGRYFCGGALAGQQHVLTSGTCVNNARLFTIQLGSNTLAGDDPYRNIFATSTYYLHPDYNPVTLENDIGIIQLHEPVMWNGYIMPIYLSTSDVQDYTDSISLGFGQIDDENAGLSNELRYVDVVTISNQECQTVYGNQITENMVCTSGNFNEGICHGDNGGPLVIPSGRYHLMIGVASFISGDGCESLHPSGYTRVHPYRDWIYNITGRYG